MLSLDNQSCPECGSSWESNLTCDDYFYQMLYWENEVPENGQVHHLMVLCYHLQHPSKYSPDGLEHAIQLLRGFVEGGLDPAEVRRKNREQLGSNQRKWKITGTEQAHGGYPVKPDWTMTARDVVEGGREQYRVNVTRWARLTLDNISKQPPSFSSENKHSHGG